MASSGFAGTGSRRAVVLVLFVFLPLVFVALYLAGSVYSASDVFEPYTLSIIAGAAAYVLFQGQFLLSSRIGFLERVVPQDKLILIHALSGLSVSVLIFIHFALKWLLVLQGATLSPQSIAGVAVLVLYAVLAPIAGTVLRGKHRPRGRRMPYEKAKALHNLFAIAGILVAAHVLMASSTWSLALRAFTAGWAVLCLGAYVHHKVVRPRRRREFALEGILEVAPGIHRFRFSAGSSTPSPARLPGQFGYWSFETGAGRSHEESSEGTERLPGPEEHPFTVSSPPGDPLEITVRSSGDFTKALPAIPPGTKVLFDGPYGAFSPEGLPEGTPLLLLAGGIGITPFLSMSGDEGPFRNHPAFLLWSVRNPEEAAFGTPLADLAERGVIRMRTAYTRSAPSGAAVGRIDADMIREAVDSLVEHSGPTGKARIRAFVCGPREFSNGMHSFLRDSGIPRRNITEERFSW